jgi:hypothetical protein
MIKNTFVSILLIWGFISLIVACNKKDSAVTNDLIGTWISTNVDTTTHYIIPNNDTVFKSTDYKDCKLQINNNGPFIMIESIDTIQGKWIQFNTDSLKLKDNNLKGKYIYDSRIELLDKTNLILHYGYVFVKYGWTDKLGPLPIEEQTEFDIKIYFKRE